MLQAQTSSLSDETVECDDMRDLHDGHEGESFWEGFRRTRFLQWSDSDIYLR